MMIVSRMILLGIPSFWSDLFFVIFCWNLPLRFIFLLFSLPEYWDLDLDSWYIFPFQELLCLLSLQKN